VASCCLKHQQFIQEVNKNDFFSGTSHEQQSNPLAYMRMERMDFSAKQHPAYSFQGTEEDPI
jgi:hypothetical protein